MDGAFDANWDATRDREAKAKRSASSRLSAAEWLAVACIVAGVAARFFARPHAPFWIDEAATGSIVSEPTFGLFWRDVYWHVSSPLYFLLLRGWSALFGLSNEALRFPSTLFSAAAPLCIAFARLPGLSRADRLCWAALVAFWLPGAGYGQAARPYALELLFATLQTLTFVRLLQRTDLRSTTLWVGTAALTISTHYLAAFLALAQGLFFLGMRRTVALRQFPALLALLPAVALIAWQGPEMARFMTPDTVWYKVFTDADVLGALLYVLGSFWWIYALPAALIIALALGLIRRSTLTAGDDFGPYLWTGFAAVLGAVALIQLAAIRPMLTYRYLAPFAPGVLLFLLVAVRTLSRGSAQAVRASLCVLAAIVFAHWVALGAYHGDSVAEDLNYQRASDEIMQRGAKSVVFMWDNPNARAMHPEQIAAYGRFFFLRDHYQINVIPAQPTVGADPNRLLLEAARPAGSAILWVYDTWVDGAGAKTHPPRLGRLDPSLDCIEFRRPLGKIGILACTRKTAL